jgi:putative transcriptional regulator
VIRCRLSALMGEKRIRVADVARGTGISRNFVARLYYDRARRVAIDDIDKLCAYLQCSVADIFQWEPGQKPRIAKKSPRDKRG